jgi:hypothetical protein
MGSTNLRKCSSHIVIVKENFDLVGVGLHRSSHMSYCHPQGHFDLIGGVVGLLRLLHLSFPEMKSTFQEYYIYGIIEFSAQDSATQLYIIMSEIFQRQLSSYIDRHHSSSQDLRPGLRFVISSVYNNITSCRH